MRQAAMVLWVLAAATAASSALAQTRLEDAYKREYAFLEAEKRALTQRIAAEKAASKKRIAAAKADVAALSGSVVALSREAENIGEMMLAAQREMSGLEQADDVLAEVIMRAESTLEKVGVSFPEATDENRAALLEQLAFAFDAAPKALAQRSSVRKQDGRYFDERGKEVNGEILWIGDVAAYGLTESATGILAPAGEGRLKLWSHDDGAKTAVALANGGSLKVLPLFLFESLDKGVEEKSGQSVREFIATGGIIGWVIVFLGCAAVLLIIGRLFLLLSATSGAKKRLRPIFEHIDRGELDNALTMAKASRSPVGRVVARALENLDDEREVMEDAVAEAILAEQPRLARFGAAILIIAAVSPLLGLLGTVTGMISTFDIITEFGTGNPKLLSGGISEALVTTELGLIVAIPALLVGHLLSGFAERARDDLDGAALATINRARGVAIDDALLEGPTPKAKVLPEPA